MDKQSIKEIKLIDKLISVGLKKDLITEKELNMILLK
jgi:hypothetical protein